MIHQHNVDVAALLRRRSARALRGATFLPGGDLFLPGLPCSLVLRIFPQGLVAVTVAAQVASMRARFSTPVLFFLPVARSHSPQAWKSYLHSPAAHKEIKHLIRCLCLGEGAARRQSTEAIKHAARRNGTARPLYLFYKAANCNQSLKQAPWA